MKNGHGVWIFVHQIQNYLRPVLMIVEVNNLEYFLKKINFIFS
jgi:hypothetical protein